MPAPVVRVVGPPGSGKTLLITSLQDALRAEGVRTATVVSRGPGLTAVTVSNGARTTLERDIPLAYVAQVVAWIDPAVDLVLAEGYEEAGAPAIELRPEGAVPLGIEEQELLTVVDTAALTASFAEHGPGYTGGAAERLLRAVLGREPASLTGEGSQPPEREPGRLGRMLRRLRG